MKRLMSGNEALARGAWEAGVLTAFGYPGTPSTEILENLVKYPDCYCEWSPNEKVALEAAAGAAIAGSRSLVTMKLVGLNVAADPLMTLSYIGITAGLVIVVADDPGQHSSQTEQDTRHYARLAKIPVFDPGNSEECRAFMIEAFNVSEKYRCPVILRTTTCVSHSRYLTEQGERTKDFPQKPFERNVTQFVPLPVWGRKLRVKVEERLDAQGIDSSENRLFNKIYRRKGGSGIISSGVTAMHCLEIFPDADILELGWPFPFPDRLLKEFAASVEKLVVIEEGDPILEEHIKSLGIKCSGKDVVPRTGELTPAEVMRIKARIGGTEANIPPPVPEASDLPARPPMLCAGCPHRGIFYALTKFDVIVTGDIGCYTLGAFPPLSRTDIVLCMGAGFSMAHGISKTGEKRPVAGIVGDSTFFHSGITGLLDLVYNHGKATLIVVDNRTTAMTGHQEHPGTGRTLMGEPATAASIEDFAKACGLKRIRVVNPYETDNVVQVLKEELYAEEPSLVISRAPCILKEKTAVKKPLSVDNAKCVNCRMCLKAGCPAIETSGKTVKPSINRALCTGCGICANICAKHAIS